MPYSLQNFLADSALKVQGELEAALLNLPAEKRVWRPAHESRTALDLVAECALLNLRTATIIEARVWPADFNMTQYQHDKTDLTYDWPRLQVLLQSNTAKVAETIRAVPEDDLKTEVQMPWGTMTLADICAYPYWNMSYHLGQINYIASLVGCL